MAGEIDQRAAGIAGIDGGVGLDEELIVGDADLGARERRDDAMGYGLADPERVADREHEVADLQLVGIAEVERREALAPILDAQHREVGAAVLEHDLGIELALVRERHLDLVRAFDHVVVGDDQAGRIDDHAGTERALHLLAWNAAAAEEEAEERVLHEVAVVHHLGGIDVDHRRRHALDDRSIGEPQLAGRGRHHALLRGQGARRAEQKDCKDGQRL